MTDMQVHQKLETLCRNSLDELNCPGLIVRLNSDKLGTFEVGVGHADLSQTTPINIDGQFYIYSPTKTLTAICILKLVESGVVKLTDAVSHFLPELKLHPNITLEHLLNHTSGIPDYCSLKEYHQTVAENPSQPWSDDVFLEKTLSRPMDFEPGSGWYYSNTGYQLLKLIIEQQTKLKFNEVIEQFIAEPLKLTNTYLATEPDVNQQLIPGFESFSDTTKRIDVRGVYHPKWCATGLVVSTTKELDCIYRALFSGNLVMPGSLKQMLQLNKVPGEHPPAVTPCYGLGLAIDPDFYFGPSYAHGGSGPGFNTWVEYLPDVGGGTASLCMVCNGETSYHEVRLRILRMLLNELESKQ